MPRKKGSAKSMASNAIVPVDDRLCNTSSSSAIVPVISSSAVSTSAKPKSRRLSAQEMQNQSKADSTRAKYLSGCNRFYEWLVEQDDCEPSLLIEGGKDIYHKIAWLNLEWSILDEEGIAMAGKASISAYLFLITFNKKKEEQFTKSVAETFWALYKYGIKQCKLVVNAAVVREWSDYLKGYKCELAKVAESSGADKSKGKDPIERCDYIDILLYVYIY